MVGLVERSCAARACVDALLGVVLVEVAGAGGLGALLAKNAELLCRSVSKLSCAGLGAIRYGPLLRTARHSSSDRLSGYDMLELDDEEDPKSAPRKGIPDIDRRLRGRRAAKELTGGGACRRERLLME